MNVHRTMDDKLFAEFGDRGQVLYSLTVGHMMEVISGFVISLGLDKRYNKYTEFNQLIQDLQSKAKISY